MILSLVLELMLVLMLRLGMKSWSDCLRLHVQTCFLAEYQEHYAGHSTQCAEHWAHDTGHWCCLRWCGVDFGCELYLWAM